MLLVYEEGGRISDTSFLEEVVAQCTYIEEIFIQDLEISILYAFDEVEDSCFTVNTLYNDFLLKFVSALRKAANLAVLRYFPFSSTFCLLCISYCLFFKIKVTHSFQ